jgi:peptidoglycan/xylan/chitin deacetylase (PgdA/CDA1 family)
MTTVDAARDPRWLRDGVVFPSHRVARLKARLPFTARLQWRLPARTNAVALTFDDGPHPVGTPAMLSTLDDLAATATFFVLTERAVADPALVREVSAAGHEIGLHGDVHEDMSSLPVRECASRLRDARRRLEDVLQSTITLHRPPLGLTSIASLRAAKRAALDVVLWTHDPRDWELDSRFDLADRIGRCLVPGAIVLLHDGAENATDPERSTDCGLRRAIEAANASDLSLRSLVGAAVQ